MGKRTYWKVQVETYDNGTIKAAVTGSKERAGEPPPYRKVRRLGFTAEIYWFDNRDNAEFFAKVIREESK
jgi:hypothetical protein